MRSPRCVATSRALCREPGTGGSALLPGESFLITRTQFKAAAMTHTPYQTHPTTMQQYQVRNFEKGWGGACVAEGVRDRGSCITRGLCMAGVHAQQRGIHGGGHAWQGCDWWGWCVARGCVWLGGMGGLHGRGPCVAGACMVGEHALQGGIHGRRGGQVLVGHVTCDWSITCWDTHTPLNRMSDRQMQKHNLRKLRLRAVTNFHMFIHQNRTKCETRDPAGTFVRNLSV